MAYLDTVKNTEPVSRTVEHAHLYDLVASDIANHVEHMATQLAEAMMEHGRAPFAAKLTRQEQEDIYYDKYADYVYNPDGTVNEGGRARLEKAFDADAVAEIYRIVIRRRRREHAAAGAPLYDYPQFADSPPTPLDAGSLAAPPPAPMPIQPLGGSVGVQ